MVLVCDAGSALGCTLVADLDKSHQEYLFQIIKAFQHTVDNALPGMYIWFDERSLHVTVRSLMG